MLPVLVDGSRGYWIEGAPHLIQYRLADGTSQEDSVRLAANVLMWEADGVTHRVETTVDLTSALRITKSLQPALVP